MLVWQAVLDGLDKNARKTIRWIWEILLMPPIINDVIKGLKYIGEGEGIAVAGQEDVEEAFLVLRRKGHFGNYNISRCSSR